MNLSSLRAAARTYATKPKPVRITKKQKAALERSAALAQTIARATDSPTPPQNESLKPETVDTPPPPTTSSSDLPADVLLPYRPPRPPPLNASLDRYTRAYTRAFARLDKAFVRDQLWTLWRADRAEEGGERRELGGKPGKRQIVQALLEEWGWPRVEQVERERQVAAWRNTVTEKDIPMTHAEAYLLLRRDPAFTQQLVAEHRVTLNMVLPASAAEGLVFRVKGKNKVLQDVEALVDARRKTIHVQRLQQSDVPGAGHTELYQPISDISGAFIESSGPHLVISYLDPAARETALSLLRAADQALGADAREARVLSVGGEPQVGAVGPTYAMYPWQSVALPIPTNKAALASALTETSTPTTVGSDWMFTAKNMFTVRRLGSVFGPPSSDDPVDLGRALARDVKDRGMRKSALLRDWLKESSANPAHWDAHQYERHVAVQQGHLVYLTDEARPAALTPPTAALQGDHPLEVLSRRLGESGMRAVFIPLSSVPMTADVQETVPPRRVRRVRYRANAAERGWTSTIDLEVGLPALEAPTTESAAHSAAGAAADAKPVIRQTYRRSWHVMCPDGDRDVSIEESVSRTLDLATEMPELRSIAETLEADAELGFLPVQLELGQLGPYALDLDDTVTSTGVVSKDAVSSLIETVDSSRTFSGAGTAFKTMAALENLNSALRANRSTL